LDIRNAANDKGILIPRVNIADLDTQTPILGTIEESLMVYNTNTTTGKGFYYWDADEAGVWVKILAGDTDKGSDWFEEGATTVPNSIDDNIWTNGSVGISTNTPDPSASIDMGRDNQGVLVNRVNLTDASNIDPVSNPANGLLVFNTNEDLTTASDYEDHVRKGFYYWDDDQNRWIPQKSEDRSARFKNTDTNSDLSPSSGYNKVPIFGEQTWNDDTGLFETIDNRNLSVKEDGRYEVKVNLSIFTENDFSTLGCQIVLEKPDGNIVFLDGLATGYIQDIEGNQLATVTINETIEIQANDTVFIASFEAGGDSAYIVMDSPRHSNFTITKIK